MKSLASSVLSIDRSPIRFILDRAAAYPEAIHLEIGQPDFPVPQHIIEAAVHAARHEYTGYTANSGMLELRKAITVKLARENNLHVTPEHVIVTVGAMHAVYATMTVLLDPGDEILLPDPGYGNFNMAARLLHAKPVFYPLFPEHGFEPNFDILETLVTKRTKALFINSPSNPTGAVFSKETMRNCLDFCRAHDLYLISDETYDRIVFEGEHASPAQWDDEGRVISIFTTSKTYAMTGWRIGYVVANPEIILAMTKIQEPMVSCVTTIAQYGAIAALLGPQDCVDAMRAEYRRRRDIAVEIALENELSVSYPHGAFYMLVDIGAQPQNSIAFCCGLLEEERVAAAPGISFGERCDRYVRVSLCAKEQALREGLPRLARYLHRLAEPKTMSLSSQRVR